MRYAIESLLAAVRRHPRLALATMALIAAIAAIAAASVARYASVTSRAPAAEEQGTRNPAGDGEEDGGDGDGSAVGPTEAQAAAEKAYGDDERALLDLLASRTWTSGAGARAEFTAAGTVSVDGGKASAIALADVARTTVAEDEPSWAAAVLLRDGGVSVLSVQTTADQQGRQTALLTAPALLGDATFEGREHASKLSVEIEDEGSLEGLGVDVSALKKAVAEWARKKAPTATTAVAQRSVDVDYEHREADVRFTLDDAGATRAVAAVSLGDGKVEVEEDTSWSLK